MNIFKVQIDSFVSLSDTRVVASVHITCNRSAPFMSIASEMKKILHKHSIHATTIQPEYIDEQDQVSAILSSRLSCFSSYIQQQDTESSCLLQCSSSKCEDSRCCKSKLTKRGDHKKKATHL